ncbi:hypothetical protein PUN28_004819 [Cardiocondyla obscurior]|uniref:Uncharacterized protein n=1 Tax=Cardiocondyla obscurior TaxID=286306 RepID=A0AAW2GFE9_9HYME
MTGSRTINERQVGAAYRDIISGRIRECGGYGVNRGNTLRGRAEDAIYHSSVKTAVTVRCRDVLYNCAYIRQVPVAINDCRRESSIVRILIFRTILDYHSAGVYALLVAGAYSCCPLFEAAFSFSLPRFFFLSPSPSSFFRVFFPSSRPLLQRNPSNVILFPSRRLQRVTLMRERATHINLRGTIHCAEGKDQRFKKLFARPGREQTFLSCYAHITYTQTCELALMILKCQKTCIEHVIS